MDFCNPEQFHAPQQECKGCPFDGPRVGSLGPIDAPIVIIGEAPIYSDVTRKSPFTGPQAALLINNIPPDAEVLFINALECVAKSTIKDRHMDTAITCCRGNLLAKIQAYPRKMIITLGNYATRVILNDSSIKITQKRGALVASPLASVGVFPVIHPSAIAQGTGSYKQWCDDLAYAFDLAKGINSREYIEYNKIDMPVDVDPAYVNTLFESMVKGTCDIETSGFNWRKDRILQIGITMDETNTATQKSSLRNTYVFYPGSFLALKTLLERRDIKWNYQNGKFDIKFLWTLGIHASVDDDTMLASYALNEEGGIHDLDTLAADHLGAPNHKHMLDEWLPNRKTSYEVIPQEVLSNYLAKDVGKTAQLRPVLTSRVYRDPGLTRLYDNVLIPASNYLAWVEFNGVYVDNAQLDMNEEYYTGEMELHARSICDAAGFNVNPGSPKQVAELLYGHLGYPNRFKGSTDADTVEALQKMRPHPILDHLAGYRVAAKMNGTYVKGWHKHIQDDGRIHATFKIHGTRTGRLSCAEPNIQNIPRLARIKGQIVAAPGYILVECDFSQAELRLLAALSKDPILCELFNSGGDPHSDLAEFLYPGWYERQAQVDAMAPGEAAGTLTPPELALYKALKAQCKEERTKCKNVNFGIIYGITAFGLSAQINGTVEEASAMLRGWYSRYSVAAAFISACRMTVVRNQVMTTPFGRKKRNGVVTRMNRPFLENEAANFPPQSIASDFTLTSGIRVYPILQEMGIKIINTVHDSIILEMPKQASIIHEGIALVRDTMRAIPKDMGIDAVPFEVDAETGHRWGATHKYDAATFTI